MSRTKQLPPRDTQLRICLFGPTGSGKSTIARHLTNTYDAELIKIAEPLYRLQRVFYETLGISQERQDGELLQFFAQKIEKEQPGWLGQQAVRQVNRSQAALVLNDDCRLNSYSALLGAGFTFIHVRTPAEVIAKRSRDDYRPVDPRHPVEQGFDQFRTDHVLANEGEFSTTLRNAEGLVKKLLDQQNSERRGRVS
jgi:energy-coupling factor transporter ATP-binding protein EcfA2